jgi:hypothetical protein
MKAAPVGPFVTWINGRPEGDDVAGTKTNEWTAEPNAAPLPLGG